MKKFYLLFALLGVAPVTNIIAQYNLTVELLAPVTGCMGSSETVSVSIVNTQSMPYAGTFHLSYSINNGTVVTTSVTAFIPASGNYTYSFAPTGDLVHCQIHEVMTAVNDPNDINFSDDTVLTEIVNTCKPEFVALGSVPVMTSGDGKVFCSVEGGQEPYFYVWTNLASFDSYCAQSWSGVGLGTYGIVVTDANDCQTDSTVEVVMGYLGDDHLSLSKPQIFFTQGRLVVQTENFENQSIIMFDGAGKQIYSEKINDTRTEIAIPLAEGIYFYQITGSQNEVVSAGKFIAK